MRTCIDQRRIKKKSVSFSQLQSFLMLPFLITKNTRTMFLLLLKTFELLAHFIVSGTAALLISQQSTGGHFD